jgi:hypothetical protein
MNELPPDRARLRIILEHLDKQVLDNETIGIYLRIQRDAVRQALARAEGEPQWRQQSQPAHPRQRRPGALPAFASSRPGEASTSFTVERQPRALGPEPARIHTGDCPHGGVKHPISAQDARAALLDPMVEACQFCCPDTELGIDLDGP